MSFSNCFLGSVRGFDELYDGKITVFPQGGKLYSFSSEIKGKKQKN